MKNIIVVGDSFCMFADGWPSFLANRLGLKLVNRGMGGEHWWGTYKFLKSLDQETINNTEVIVFAHTFSGRIPTNNPDLGKFNVHNLDINDEQQLAIKLYYKYIKSQEFLEWAQVAWFHEITREYSSKKLVHLHGFPWSLKFKDTLLGMNIEPNLTALSLNELNAKDLKGLAGDPRQNHFNNKNNQELAKQLAEAIRNFKEGTYQLDIEGFDLKTKRWLDWS